MWTGASWFTAKKRKLVQGPVGRAGNYGQNSAHQGCIRPHPSLHPGCRPQALACEEQKPSWHESPSDGVQDEGTRQRERKGTEELGTQECAGLSYSGVRYGP